MNSFVCLESRSNTKRSFERPQGQIGDCDMPCHGCGRYLRKKKGISCGKNSRGEQSLADSGLSQVSDGHRKILVYRYPQETIGFFHGYCLFAENNR